MTPLDPLCRLLDSVEPPAPPAGLEARSLAAACTALARAARRPDLWTRLWESRPARLAWAATLAALVLGHVALSRPRPGVDAQPALPAFLAGSIRDAELAEVATLPRLRSERLLDPDGAFSRHPAEPIDRTAPRREGHDA